MSAPARRAGRHADRGFGCSAAQRGSGADMGTARARIGARASAVRESECHSVEWHAGTFPPCGSGREPLRAGCRHATPCLSGSGSGDRTRPSNCRPASGWAIGEEHGAHGTAGRAARPCCSITWVLRPAAARPRRPRLVAGWRGQALGPASSTSDSTLDSRPFCHECSSASAPSAAAATSRASSTSRASRPGVANPPGTPAARYRDQV